MVGNYLSLGSVTTFEGGGSQPAKVISVSPASAVCSDTVVIAGKNFYFTPANNKVFFDGNEARVIISNPEEMRVIVPPAKELPIRIDVAVSGLGQPMIWTLPLSRPRFPPSHLSPGPLTI